MSVKFFRVFAWPMASLFFLTALPAAAEAPAPEPSGKLPVLTGPDALEASLKKTIDLEYKNADLANVLRSMAWTYQLNIVTSPNIKGNVSINLKGITVQDALDAILSINGLTYSKRNGVIYISPGNPDVVETATEVISLKYLTAAEAQNTVKELLSAKGSVKINESSNIIIVTDFPANIAKVKALISKMDSAPLQVLIEAKIVDITTNEFKALGVTYSVDYAPGKGLFGRNTRFAEELDTTVSLPEQSSNVSGGQIAISALTLKNVDVTATIDALIHDGKATLLASPSIAVLNGQEARIVIGERFPYKERTQTTSGTTETTKFADIGTTLKVKPQINNDGYITMSVHPEVSSLLQSLDAGPRITTREADTTVRIKEGETLVIGGLINRQDSRNREKIPIAGDIPILGKLFSRDADDKEQKELAVFITPKIIRSKAEKEQLSPERVAVEDAFVIAESAARLNSVDNLLYRAIELDHGDGLPTVRDDIDHRKAQAMNIYEHILAEYPDNERVPEVRYRMGMIYLDYYHDYRRAKKSFEFIMTRYPNSPFAQKAKKAHRKTEERQAGLE